MIVLLDTTVLIHVLRNRKSHIDQIAAMVQSNHLLVTSAMNLAEVYAGVRRGEEAKTEGFLSSLEVYPITPEIARLGGDLKRAWALQGRTLELPDTLIAATALEHGLTLMTDNRKDFPMPELRFYDLP